MAIRLWRLTQVLLALEFVLLLAVFASCQGAGGQGATPGLQATPLPIPPGIVVEYAGADGSIAGQGALGFFNFTLNPATNEATLEPVKRNLAGLGDPYNVDITGFLAGTPCIDCFKIDGLGMTPDQYPYVDFSIRHPFALPENNPPSSSDRVDLHVYDVKGIFLKPDPEDERAMGHFVGLSGGPTQPSTLTVDNSGFLAGIELDGITDAFDAYTDGFYPTLATAHPFILMHEDTRTTNFDANHPNGWPDHRDPMGHNVFPQGGGPYIKRMIYTAQPGEQVTYLVVLTANFASASTGRGSALGERANPITYLPWANSKSPWRVTVDENTNNLKQDDPATQATLVVQVYDWQHQFADLTVVPSFRVENQPRNSLLRSSKITGVRVSVPGVANEDEISVASSGGAGSPQDPLRYSVIIPNTQDADEGTYIGALRIQDDYEPGPTAEGVGRGFTPFFLEDSSTYHTFSVSVEPPVDDPVEIGEGSAAVYNGNNPESESETVVFDARSAGNMAAGLGAPERPFVVCEVKGMGTTDGSDIAFCASPNGGDFFNPAVIVNTDNQPGDQTAPDIAATPDGLGIHVVYQGPAPGGKTMVYYSRSGNFGTTFSPSILVNPSSTFQQFNPSVAVHPEDGNQIAVAYEQHSGGSSNICVSFSSNGGNTFGTPLILDATTTANLGQRRLNPMVRYPYFGSGEANTIAVIWEKRNSTGPDVMAAISTSGAPGLPFGIRAVSNEPLTAQATNASMNFFPNVDGADLLVAYNQQTRANVGIGGNDPITVVVASKVMGNVWRAEGNVFMTPMQLSRTSDVTVAGMPAVVVLKKTMPSKVAVVWDDNRNRFSSGSDIFCAISHDQATSWLEDFKLIGDPGNQRLPAAYANNLQKLRVAFRDESKFARASIQFRRVD